MICTLMSFAAHCSRGAKKTGQALLKWLREGAERIDMMQLPHNGAQWALRSFAKLAYRKTLASSLCPKCAAAVALRWDAAR